MNDKYTKQFYELCHKITTTMDDKSLPGTFPVDFNKIIFFYMWKVISKKDKDLIEISNDSKLCNFINFMSGNAWTGKSIFSGKLLFDVDGIRSLDFYFSIDKLEKFLSDLNKIVGEFVG